MKDLCNRPVGREGYDVAVVGAGSAGFSAAITAAELGAKVALIGHGIIGGTCVNVGCVPSKTLIRAAEAVHGGKASARFPGLGGSVSLDNWTALATSKDELVTELRQKKYIDLLPAYEGVTYIDGKARFADGKLLVGDAPMETSKVILAMGARAAVPPIPGLDNVPYLTSTSALALERLPKSLLVIGGGVIGVELGQMFARLGVTVTICCRSRLLPEMDPEVGAALQSYLEAEGVRVCSGIGYQRIDPTGNGIELICESLSCDGEGHCDTVAAVQTIAAEQVLIATGRRPNSDGMGLEDHGIALGQSGGIVVDDYLESSVPGIYAAGDITGRDQFVYMAAYGAKLAARNAVEGNQDRYDNSTMPSVVFTDPQVASVGLTETAARAQGLEVKVSLLPLDAVPRALAARDTRGLIKLVADKASDRLLGGQIVAPEGADSIQTLVLAIKCGMTAVDLGATIFPYLTTVEGLKLAAQTFDKDVAKLSCCAG
ncbi:MAG: mercury(II) reductase [Sphingomonas sp.]|uniref:mercury(II) reductase n=1 Tax=Sphingomonadaceae TaxID=41297 RepID=UPI0006C8996D|nr:mercury(II) reductase [Novosphingobium sp. ST904]KPH62287.1 mercuric reductase [Novosphingobium sp. ST904]MBY0304076.1 mercury(II) reductase [Sphingomonas sp.]TCM43381.1 mercuric reductase [Novosphingobium sp. ST904]